MATSLELSTDSINAAVFKNKNEATQEFILYHKRWPVLFSFCLLSMSSAWMWITWSPLTRIVSDYWGVNEGAVDALSGVYLYIYVPGSFLSLYWVVTYGGLRRGLLAGGLCNLVGAGIRYAGRNDYWTVYVGTVIAAIAQTFVLATPPLIAGKWFGAHERATATALGVLANQAGTALGLGMTVVVDFGVNFEETLELYLGVQVVVAAIAIVMVALHVADEPLTPPSKATLLATSTKTAAAAADTSNPATEQTLLFERNSSSGNQSPLATNDTHQLSYIQSIYKVVGNPSSLAFLVSFGMSVGVYYTIPTFLSQLLPWSSVTTGWLGVGYQVAGIVGSFGSGRLVDITQQHRAVCILLLGLALVSLTSLVVATTVDPTGGSWLASAGLIFGIAGAGFSLAAWNTVGLEFGTSISYPADEAAVAGLLECAAELAGFLGVTIGGALIETRPSRFLFVLVSAAAVSFLLLGCSRTTGKRPA